MTTPRFSQITFLHGRNELPSGYTKRLEAVLREAHPAVTFACPFVPSDLDAKRALEFVKRNYVSRIKDGSLLVGLERGGLIACAVQRDFPSLRLSAFAANAPTSEDGVEAGECPAGSRVAVYSSKFPPIVGLCDWKASTPMAYDVPWMASGKSMYPLAYLISVYAHGADMDKHVAKMFPSGGAGAVKPTEK
jgi:hypothetical protein